MLGYYPREDDRVTHRTIRDTESIGASYDRYLRNGVGTVFYVDVADICVNSSLEFDFDTYL